MPLFNLEDMLLFMLFAFIVACLAQAFQAFMKPGQIFNWWAIWLQNIVTKASIEPTEEYSGPCWNRVVTKVGPGFFVKLIAKLSKPLGLCPYCNATWIAIFYYISIVSWEDYIYENILLLLLFIGVVWFFVFSIENRLVNPKKK